MTRPGQLAALADAFHDRVGAEPEGVWLAPGRMNLIGEHTDYNDGFVLPLAIDRGLLLAAARRDDGVLRVWSLQEDDPVSVAIAELSPGRVTGWAAYVAGVVWALRAAGHPVPGADLVLSGDLPPGAGLASSAALECGTALVLDDLYDLGMAPQERALLAQRGESDFVGMPCGLMDQLACVLGRAGHALFLDTRSLTHEHLPLDPAGAGLALLVIDTRVRHSLAEGRYADRRSACESAAGELGLAALRDLPLGELDRALTALEGESARRVRHVVTENARVLEAADLLRQHRLAGLGRLLTASHASLRDDFDVSGPELDAAVDAALRAGALGARMTGAGFGGSAIALVAARAVPDVATAVADAFDRRGWRRPEVYPAVPSDGARRVRLPRSGRPGGS